MKPTPDASHRLVVVPTSLVGHVGRSVGRSSDRGNAIYRVGRNLVQVRPERVRCRGTYIAVFIGLVDQSWYGARNQSRRDATVFTPVAGDSILKCIFVVHHDAYFCVGGCVDHIWRSAPRQNRQNHYDDKQFDERKCFPTPP